MKNNNNNNNTFIITQQLINSSNNNNIHLMLFQSLIARRKRYRFNYRSQIFYHRYLTTYSLFYAQSFHRFRSSSLIRPKDWWNRVINEFTEEEFRENFRLQWDSFNKLAKFLSDCYESTYCNNGRPIVPIKFSLAVLIWRLATQQSLREVAQQFNINRSLVHQCTIRVCNLIRTNLKHIISLPKNRHDWSRIQNEFEIKQRSHKNEFPGVCGALDGTHIRIIAPNEYPEHYFNRKGYHSIVVSALVDSNCCFMDINVGQPGCSHDSSVFKTSWLGKNVHLNLETKQYILADSAYAITPFLITPFYHSDSNMNIPKRIFNKVHSSNRIVVERTFGLVKSRWRKLQYMNIRDLGLLTMLIEVACILHNYLQKEKDFIDDTWFQEDEGLRVSDNEIVEDSLNLFHELTERQLKHRGKAEREQLVEQLSQLNTRVEL